MFRRRSISAGTLQNFGKMGASTVVKRKKFSWRLRVFEACLVSLMLGAATSAQAQAPTREEIQRDRLEQQLRAEGEAVVVEDGIRRAPCPLADERFAALRFTLREARFAGLEAIDGNIVTPAYADLVGQDVPVSVVCDIRDRATDLLRDAGYLAAVQIPTQQIEDGNVLFNVVLARMTQVQVRGDAGPSERALQKYIDKLTSQPVFNIEQAERYLLLARDIPGLDVRLTLSPASRNGSAQPGEVVGIFNVVRTPVYANISVQNFGSKSVGRFGALARVSANGLTGLGDQTTLSFYSTLDFDEQQVLQAGHEFRLGGEGLTIGGNFTYAWTEPGAPAPDGFESETQVGSIYATYPFIRKQASNLFGTVGLDIIDQQLDFGSNPATRVTDDQLRVAFVRLDFNAIDPDSVMGRGGYTPYEPEFGFAGSLEVRQGLDIFGASEPCSTAPTPCLRTRFDGDPTAFVIRAQAQLDYRPTPLLKFSLQPRLQYSPDALLSYEEFSGGNYTVGRGYDPGTVIGDSGLGLTGEIAYGSLIPDSPKGIAIQPYAFVDYIRIWQDDYSLTPNEERDLTSIGGGVRATIGRQASLDAKLAVPLDKLPFQNERNDVRFLITLTTQLAPWYD